MSSAGQESTVRAVLLRMLQPRVLDQPRSVGSMSTAAVTIRSPWHGAQGGREGGRVEQLWTAGGGATGATLDEQDRPRRSCLLIPIDC